jgi:hypothetical protein
MLDNPLEELSRSFAKDVTAFAKEFEIAIEVLESHYLNHPGVHREEMCTRIKKMKELRAPWRYPKNPTEHPAQSQIFTALQEVVRHVFCKEEEPEKSIEIAVDLYLVLQRLRAQAGSSWLACAIFDMEAELLREVRATHALTEPMSVSI